jgi:hypothetical protein
MQFNAILTRSLVPEAPLARDLSFDFTCNLNTSQLELMYIFVMSANCMPTLYLSEDIPRCSQWLQVFQEIMDAPRLQTLAAR